MKEDTMKKGRWDMYYAKEFAGGCKIVALDSMIKFLNENKILPNFIIKVDIRKPTRLKPAIVTLVYWKPE